MEEWDTGAGTTRSAAERKKHTGYKSRRKSRGTRESASLSTKGYEVKGRNGSSRQGRGKRKKD